MKNFYYVKIRDANASQPFFDNIPVRQKIFVNPKFFKYQDI